MKGKIKFNSQPSVSNPFNCLERDLPDGVFQGSVRGLDKTIFIKADGLLIFLEYWGSGTEEQYRTAHTPIAPDVTRRVNCVPVELNIQVEKL